MQKTLLNITSKIISQSNKNTPQTLIQVVCNGSIWIDYQNGFKLFNCHTFTKSIKRFYCNYVIYFKTDNGKISIYFGGIVQQFQTRKWITR